MRSERPITLKQKFRGAYQALAASLSPLLKWCVLRYFRVLGSMFLLDRKKASCWHIQGSGCLEKLFFHYFYRKCRASSLVMGRFYNGDNCIISSVAFQKLENVTFYLKYYIDNTWSTFICCRFIFVVQMLCGVEPLTILSCAIILLYIECCKSSQPRFYTFKIVMALCLSWNFTLCLV